ncbi:MAG: LacI family DNA-binding transcriptional regulator [Verrucomicrobiales bacterium]
MIRLKDIALQAGVSVMTVSKVLRDAPDISAATKVRIKQIAEQMGYVPDTGAQGLRTRTTRLIGLVVSSVANPIFARAILAIEEKAYELGYEVILAHSLNEPAREEMVIKRLLARRVDGFVISPVYRMAPHASIYKELAASESPTVILGHRASFCHGFLNAETDDFHNSCETTQHLIDLGHRQIAFFAGPSSAPWAQERLEGYKKSLRDAGIEVEDNLIFQAGTGLEDGERAALQLLNESVQATAIQACNDLVATGAMSALLKQGIRAPEDISVTGFGNILLSEHCRIPLTTVRQPKFRLGMAAMEILQKLLRDEPAESKRLRGDLIVRESSSTPGVGLLKSRIENRRH